MTTLGAIEIVTADMAASLAFYRTLGIGVAAGMDAEPHVDAELPGGIRLMWDTTEVARATDPDWAPAVGGARMRLAFDCGSAAGVDATITTLRADGVTVLHDPWDAFWGQRYAVVSDPDGNPVDLYAAQ